MSSVLCVVAVLLPTWVFAQSSMYLEEIEQYVVTPCLQARMHKPGGRSSDVRTLLETFVGSALDETRKRLLPLVRGKKRAQRMVLYRAARDVCIKGG